MKTNIGNLIPKLYYTITPAFILLDYIWGINIRVAALNNYPLYKGFYYGFCILCGVIIYLVPQSSPFVALTESAIIIMLTVISFLSSYVQIFSQAYDVMNADFETINILNPQYITNLFLAGGIACITFNKSMRELGISRR